MAEDKKSKQNPGIRGTTDDQTQEAYTFMREVIKESPKKKGAVLRMILKKSLTILASGIAAGVIAAITFGQVLPYFMPEKIAYKIELQKEDKDTQISFEEDKNEVQTPEEGETQPDITPEPTSSPETMTLEEFRQLHQEMIAVAQEAERALVLVQGITRQVDWMNNSYENKTQISGVLVAENSVSYYVLTEYRVVEQVEQIVVTFCDGSTAHADFVKYDPGTGIAVLKVAKKSVDETTKKKIQIAVLGNSGAIKRGELVIAIGSPTGYSGSVSCGMVTSVNNVRATTDAQYHLLTTDILGDSEGSGVMISLEGEVIGVMVQNFFEETNQNVLTAIPISEVKKLIEKLINEEELVYFGIVGQDITAELSANTEIPVGIYVNLLREDSPAMQAGIQNGDVIVQIEDEPVETLQSLQSLLRSCESGKKIAVKVLRRGAADRYVQIMFDVTLGAL